MPHSVNIVYLEQLKSDTDKTIIQIAEESGVPLGTVKRIFAGTTESPSVTALADIVEILGGSMDALMGLNLPTVEPAQPRSDPSIHEAYEIAYRNSRESFENAYRKLSESHESCMRDKDRWLLRLFSYSIIVTVALVAVSLIAQLK